MSGIFNELFNKVISIICAVVFVLGVGGFLIYTVNTTAAEEARLDAIREASAPLEYEKAMYVRELNGLEGKMLASLPSASTLTFVVTSSSENLYTKLYPLFAATHELCDSATDIPLTGTICFTPATLPGSEGRITVEQYEELKEAGWSTALYISAGHVADIDTYLESAKTAFEGAGMEMPTVAYFAKRAYTPNVDGNLLAYGINGVFHHEEEEFDLICQDAESAIWRVGSVDWNTKNVAPATLTSILNTQGNVAFAFGFSESEPNSHFIGDPMANGSVDRMLDTIRQNVNAGDLYVEDITFGKGAYVEYLNEYNEKYPLLEPMKEELRAIIADLDARLVKIYSGILPTEEENS